MIYINFFGIIIEVLFMSSGNHKVNGIMKTTSNEMLYNKK